MAETTDLIYRILARDEASAKLLKHAATLGVVGLAVFEFARKSVERYEEAQKAEDRLVFAYHQFPKAANVSIESMNRLAEATQRKTIYDHTQTEQAQAMLLQFNLTGKQVEQLIPLVQDYASATGQDLLSATTSVGKAFAGNARALKQVGINFKATGNTAADFATIMDLLNQKVGGFAEKQGKTAAGQVEILKNEFGDLEQQVGSMLVPALTDLVSVEQPLVAGFNALPGPVKDTALGITALGIATLVVVPQVAKLKAALVELNVVGDGAATKGGLSKLGGVLAGGGLAGGLAVASAAAVAGGALFAMGHTMAHDSDVANSYADALQKDAGQLGEVTKATIAKQLADDGAIKKLNQVGISVGMYTNAIMGNKDALGYVNQALDAYNAANGQSITATSKAGAASNDAAQMVAYLRNELLSNSQALANQVGILDEENAATAGLAGTTDDARKATLDYTSALKPNTDAILANMMALESKTIAQYDATKADADARKAVKDLGKAHHETKAQVQDAMRTILDAAHKESDAQKDPAKAASAYISELQSLEKTTKPGSPLRRALDSYIAKAKQLNFTATTRVDIKVYANGKPLTGAAALRYITKNTGGFDAAGGYEHFAGGGFWAGEYGPEFIQRSGMGARVFTATQSKTLGHSDRPQVLQVILDGRVLAQSQIRQERSGVQVRLAS